MRLKFFYFILILATTNFLFSCAQAPTKVKQEVGGERSTEVVIVDVRSSLENMSYQISGSVSLRTEDFIILTGPEKSPEQRKRIFDPDLEQTIERLSRRGVSPERKIILVYSNETEAFKWIWLLKQLGVADIEMLSLNQYIEKNRPLRPKPAPPVAVPWLVTNKSFILKEAEFCFVGWAVSECIGD